MKLVDFEQAEIIQPKDWTAISQEARDHFDAIHQGAWGWPVHWARITVSKKAGNSTTVVVSDGEFHTGKPVYRIGDNVELDLQEYFGALAGGDESWLALILRGTEETIEVQRPFETSDQPLIESKPVQRGTVKYHTRKAEVIVQPGTIGPAPQPRPTIAETNCCVAFVRVNATGVQDIVVNQAARVKTVFEIEGRLTVVEGKVETLYQATQAIVTDLATVAAAVERMPDPRLIDQFARDISRTRQELQFPEEARNYWFDQALVKDLWDLQHPDSLVRVQEGLRFPYAAVRNSQLFIAQPDNPDIVVIGGKYVLPAYDEVMRIESPLGSGRVDISNTVHTIQTAHTGTTSTTSIRYGPTVKVCENTSGWNTADLADRRAGEIFAVSGKEYQSLGKTDNPWNNTTLGQNGHAQYAVQNVIRDTIVSTYTYYTTETYGLNGALYAQTFLSSQMMVATRIDLYLTRVGSTGDITLALCEVLPDGTPHYDRIITQSVVEQADLRVNQWVPFVFDRPTLLEPGKRYAWFTVTTGNHQIAANSGNTFTGGTKFQCSDGIFSQGSTTEDFSFRLYAAKFKKSRVTIQMEPIELENGMTEIQLVYEGWEPAGTSRPWDIKPIGADEWVPMDGRDPNPLTNLPPQCNLRCTLVGTQDVAPMLVMDTYSRVQTGRCRSDVRAVSDEIAFGYATSTIRVVMNVDAFDPNLHDYDPKIMVGGVTIDPQGVTLTPDPTKPGRSQYAANFPLGAPATSARLRIEGTSTSVVAQAFVQDIQLNAY